MSDNDETSSLSDEEVTSRKRSVDPSNGSDKEVERKKPRKRVTSSDQHVSLLHRLFPYQTVDVSRLILTACSNFKHLSGVTTGA